VSIPHTVRRAGAAINPVIIAVNVTNPRAVKHGLNAPTSSATDRGRLSDRNIAGHVRYAVLRHGSDTP
jgi:hypothetical protein